MTQKTVLYVSCGGTHEIVRFALDSAKSSLKRLGVTRLPSPPDAAAKPTARLRTTGAPLAASRQGTRLYAASRVSPSRVLSFAIAAKGGALTLLGEAPTPEGTVYLTADPFGRYLLGAAYYANAIWVSQIDAQGIVTGPPLQSIQHVTTAHSVVLHPSGQTAYAGATGLEGVQVFHFGEGTAPLSGRRAAQATSPGATPRHLAVHPGGRFLWCINETSSVIDAFALRDNGGALTLVQSIDLRPAAMRGEPGIGADIIVSADGRRVYASERKRGTVVVFAVDQDTGKLTQEQVLEVGSIPRSLALDPSGKFLAAAIQGEGMVKLYAVSPSDGSLTLSAIQETGGAPIWVEFVSLPSA